MILLMIIIIMIMITIMMIMLMITMMIIMIVIMITIILKGEEPREAPEAEFQFQRQASEEESREDISPPPLLSQVLSKLFMIKPGRKRFGPIRFGSKLVRKLFGSVRFGSVRKCMFPGSTWFGLRFSDTPWLCPVRFGAVPRPVPAGSGITRFGSIRFGWFGSVSHFFLSLVPPGSRRGASCMYTASKQYARKRASHTHTFRRLPPVRSFMHKHMHMHHRKDTIRFDSFRFQTFRKLIGSVRFDSEMYFSRFDVVRLAFFGHAVALSGSVRCGSASDSGRFRNSTVRFGSAGWVRFLLPSC